MDTARSEELAAYAKRCKMLEERVALANRLVEAEKQDLEAARREKTRLQERLQRAEIAIATTEREKEIMEQVHQNMALTHLQDKEEMELRWLREKEELTLRHLLEKEELEKKVKMLANDLQEFQRPWYQQNWRRSV